MSIDCIYAQLVYKTLTIVPGSLVGSARRFWNYGSRITSKHEDRKHRWSLPVRLCECRWDFMRVLVETNWELRAFSFPAYCQDDCAPVTERIDCHPDVNATEERCLARGCLWCPAEGETIPYCTVKRTHGYTMESLLPDGNGYRVLLRRTSLDSSYFGNDFELLNATVTFESDYRLRIKVRRLICNWLICR